MAKVTNMILTISQWKQSNEFARFHSDFEEEIDVLEASYKDQLPIARRILASKRLIFELQIEIEQGLMPTAGADMRRKIRGAID